MSIGGSIRAAAGCRRVAIAAAALLAAGCTSVSSTGATFEGTRWQVIAINAQATPRTDEYRLQFERGRIGGAFGCNQFGGTYRVQGDVMVATDIAQTLMGCPEPAGTFERNGTAVLQQPMRTTWHSDRQLTLSNGAGSLQLELQR